MKTFVARDFAGFVKDVALSIFTGVALLFIQSHRGLLSGQFLMPSVSALIEVNVITALAFIAFHTCRTGNRIYVEDQAKIAEQKGQLGTFSPFQLEAFLVAEEMRDFLDELGSMPTVPEMPQGTTEQMQAFLETRHIAEQGWRQRLIHGYGARGFADKIESLRLRAGETGQPIFLADYARTVVSEQDVLKFALQLEALAIRSNYSITGGANGNEERISRRRESKKQLREASNRLTSGSETGNPKEGG